MGEPEGPACSGSPLGLEGDDEAKSPAHSMNLPSPGSPQGTGPAVYSIPGSSLSRGLTSCKPMRHCGTLGK